MKSGERACSECGTVFRCSPSSKKVTCSKACSSVRKHKTHIGKSNKWTDESKAKIAAKGKTDNLQRGTPAAKKSPIAGPFETNQEAKTWWLLSPSNVRYEVRNLRKFIRDNPTLFDGTLDQANSGLRQVQLSLMGKTKRQVSQWKGWRLTRPAE